MVLYLGFLCCFLRLFFPQQQISRFSLQTLVRKKDTLIGLDERIFFTPSLLTLSRGTLFLKGNYVMTTATLNASSHRLSPAFEEMLVQEAIVESSRTPNNDELAACFCRYLARKGDRYRHYNVAKNAWTQSRRSALGRNTVIDPDLNVMLRTAFRRHCDAPRVQS